MEVELEQFSLRVPRDPNRSEGLHLSTVLRSMALARGVLASKYEDQGDLNANVVLQVGMAWEDYLAKSQHPEIEYHPGELHLDGIAMSPDGVSIVEDEVYADSIGVEPESWILHEFKATRKSSRGFADILRVSHPKVKLWLWQVMAYRHALNRLAGRECNVAKLHVLFLNGNYSRDLSDPEGLPSYRIFRLKFDSSELQSNWDVIKSYAEGMSEEERAA